MVVRDLPFPRFQFVDPTLARELRRIDPQTGEVRQRLAMPAGTLVSGLESDGKDRFFCVDLAIDRIDGGAGADTASVDVSDLLTNIETH